MKRQHDAFLSYSHARDLVLARELHYGLQRFAKPWFRARGLRVFRDESNLAANPELWPTLEAAVRGSKAFVLLASPESAASPGVRYELATWFASGEHARSRFFVVVTGGAIAADASRRIDWGSTTALPDSLHDRLEHEPLFLKAPVLDANARVSWDDPELIELVASLSAAIQGIPKEELYSREAREQEKRRTVVRAVVATLLLLSIGLGFATWSALENAARAKANEELALEARDEARARYRDAQRNLANATALLAREARGRRNALAHAVYAAGAATAFSTPETVAELLAQPPPAMTPALRFRVRVGRDSFLALDPDGTTVLTPGENGSVAVRESATARLRTVLAPAGCSSKCVAFSPDGTWLAVGVTPNPTGVGGKGVVASDAIHVVIYEVDGWRERARLGIAGQFHPGRAVAFSEDSRRLAVGVNESVRLWDVGSGFALRRDALRLEKEGAVARIAFGRGSAANLLAASYDSGALALFDVGTGRLLRHTRLPEAATKAWAPLVRPTSFDLCWTSAERFVACGRGPELHVARADDFASLERVEGHDAIASALCLVRGRRTSPGPDALLSAAWDGRLRLQGARSFELVEEVDGGAEGTSRLAAGARGDVVAALGSDGTVTMWRVAADSRGSVRALSGAVVGAAFVAGSGRLLPSVAPERLDPTRPFAPNAGVPRLFRCEAGETEAAALEGGWQACLSANFPPGRAVALARADGSGSWLLARAKSGEALAQIPCVDSPAEIAAAVDPTERWVALASSREGGVQADALPGMESTELPREQRSLLVLHDLRVGGTGTQLFECPRITALGFDGRGAKLAVSTLYGEAWLFDVRTHERRAIVAVAPGAPLRVLFEPHGSRLVGLESTGRVWVLDADEPSSVPVYLSSLERGAILAAAFHPGGELLAVAPSDGSLWFLELAKREPYTSIESSGSPIVSLGFRDDGLELAVGRTDGTLSVLGGGAVERVADVEARALLTMDRRSLELKTRGGVPGRTTAEREAGGVDAGLAELWRLLAEARSLDAAESEESARRAEVLARRLDRLRAETLESGYALLAEDAAAELSRRSKSSGPVRSNSASSAGSSRSDS